MIRAIDVISIKSDRTTDTNYDYKNLPVYKYRDPLVRHSVNFLYKVQSSNIFGIRDKCIGK